MNKEEIEKLLKINETIITSKQCKEHRTLRNDERTLLMNNIKIKEHIEELEQKESMLDKVTNKLKEDIKKTKEKIKYWEERYRIAKEKKEEFYIKSFHRQINRCQSRFETLRELLNIIEEKRNNGKLV